MSSAKIFLCAAVIVSMAFSSGCGGAVKTAVKEGGKAVTKTVSKVPGAVKDQAVDLALDAAINSNTPQGNKTSPTKSSVAKRGMVMAGGAAVASEILTEDRHWIKDLNNGAYVWNPEPQDGESVRWSGDVVREGDNLYAQGRGTLTWYRDGQVIQTDEGYFERGKHNGKFKHTFKSGNVDYSNWDHGQEIPLDSPADNTANARQAFMIYHRNITDGNYRAAYDTLSNAQKERVGDFSSYAAGFADTISSEVSDISLISSNGDSCTFHYTLTARDRYQGGRVKVQIFSGEVTMAKDKGHWYIRYAKSDKVGERID